MQNNRFYDQSEASKKAAGYEIGGNQGNGRETGLRDKQKIIEPSAAMRMDTEVAASLGSRIAKKTSVTYLDADSNRLKASC